MKEKTNGFGVTSLVTGLVGLVLFPIVLGIIAIVFGAIGLNKGQKYSKAGLILGIIDVIWFFILIFLLASFFAALF